MNNMKLSNEMPAPQPVSSDYIVAAHYYAAWKKGSAEIHNGFDDLHLYPERTPLMGYYDEENPDVCDWEIKWAVEHGINCFIHCWYRYRDNVGHPVTPDALRCGHGLHEALFHAKYQQLMKFAIMFETQTRWGATNKDDMLQNLMPFWMETYFTRGNYLIVDNKPVLFVYDTKQQLQNAFASAAEQHETFDRCREFAKSYGFDGMIFAAQADRCDEAAYRDFMARGYDFCFSYNCGYNGPAEFPSDDEVVESQKQYVQSRIDTFHGRFVPTASAFLDWTPRFTKAWVDRGYHFSQYGNRWHCSPDGFRRVLRNCKAMADALPQDNPGRKIIMIDNWNEWDEGHYVSPSVGYGFRYLQAIREELTHRDNLPDYRTPQDLGLTGYNKSWGEPDLNAVCVSKFGVKYD